MPMITAFLQRWLGRRWGRKDAQARCKVLFVCMANLCRSPTAEAVFRHHIERAGLAHEIACASAGTHEFNAGSAPDGRARAAASKRGYDMSRFRGRGVIDEDFTRFDLIVAMDRQNLEALRSRCPPEQAGRLRLLMEFAQQRDALDIPDPYYGNAQGFEVVLDMIEDACAALLQHVRSTHLAGPQAGEVLDPTIGTSGR
jgi:protein-tyrosine phosphatase